MFDGFSSFFLGSVPSELRIQAHLQSLFGLNVASDIAYDVTENIKFKDQCIVPSVRERHPWHTTRVLP